MYHLIIRDDALESMNLVLANLASQGSDHLVQYARELSDRPCLKNLILSISDEPTNVSG